MKQVENNNPIDLNLLGFCYDSAVNIDNTVGGWTLLPQRAPLLNGLFSNRIEVRKELFRSGYSITEIARDERPEVSIEAIRQTTLNISRYVWAARLREIFPSKGTRWGTDDLIAVLRDTMNGLTQNEIAGKYGVNRSRLINKRDGLISVGFPLPDLLQYEKPSWVKLQSGKDWITLSNALRIIMGRRLRTFDLLSQSLQSEGIRQELRSKNDRGSERFYYFILVTEVKNLANLYQRKPEIFRSRTWSIFPHTKNLPSGYIIDHDLGIDNDL